MGVPKHRGTSSKRNMRRSHIRLKKKGLTNCSHCGRAALLHSVCKECGYYKGREVINVLAKLEKKERKKREKEIKAREKEKGKEKKPMTMEELSRKKF